MLDGHPGRNERTGERAEGMRHDDELPGSRQRLRHSVGVIAGSRLLIVERERRRDGFVAEAAQHLEDGAVYARIVARARDQHEGRHAGPRSSPLRDRQTSGRDSETAAHVSGAGFNLNT